MSGVNSVYGIRFVPDHVTHVQANCSEGVIPSAVPRRFRGQCASMFLVMGMYIIYFNI